MSLPVFLHAPPPPILSHPGTYLLAPFITHALPDRSPEDVTRRLDRLIAEIRTKYQEPYMADAANGSRQQQQQQQQPHDGTGDVLVVGHGHILRAFAMRWVGKTLQDGPTFLMEAGGVGTLSYEHKNIREPAVLLGGAFVVDDPEEAIAEARRD